MDLFKFAGLIITYGPSVLDLFKSSLALVDTYKAQHAADPVASATMAIQNLHGMSSEEEKAWFDRASFTTGL